MLQGKLNIRVTSYFHIIAIFKQNETNQTHRKSQKGYIGVTGEVENDELHELKCILALTFYF